METFILERNNRIILTHSARIVRAAEDITQDLAENTNWELEQSNPFITWITGDFVEADKPNGNTQFWTKNDLALNEYSIKYAPLNMLHKQKTPVGFFASTRLVNLGEVADANNGTAKIEALAGIWSHVFPWETALIKQAEDMGQLFLSMECRGSHLHCAGPNGCDNEFAYSDTENHCSHLKERSSIRHIVNPTFRGGAIIIPPTKPGWSNAVASVYQDSIKDEASKYAEMTEYYYEQAKNDGLDLSVSAWESVMAQVLALTDN